MNQIESIAKDYLREEPSLEYRKQTQDLLSTKSFDELSDRLIGNLHFGTAGIRAKMEAGFMRLNQVSIKKIAYAISVYLSQSNRNSRILLGYDARHHSREFAETISKVLTANGHQAYLFVQVIPTPILAFATKEFKADLGIIITASHNPPWDNGIKLYQTSSAQIIAPATTNIEELIKKAPSSLNINISNNEPLKAPNSLIEAYFREIAASPLAPRNDETRDIKIIYTPMHGVGGLYTPKALKSEGFNDLHIVPSQAKPDGNFPTVEFPNPEEKGALFEAQMLSKELNADLILANDPDADRLAVSIGDRVLTGNEIGILLGAHIAENYTGTQKGLLMTTYVSSRMLSKIASLNHLAYAETQTGFSNIAQEALRRESSLGEVFLFGYEEALGYCAGNQVYDKDGISAAVQFAKLFAQLKSQNKTVFEELDRLWIQYGLHQSLSWSIRASRTHEHAELQRLLIQAQNLKDFKHQSSPHPSLVSYSGDHHLRLLVRPSGTEPKIKFYAEAIGYPKTIAELKASKKVLAEFLLETQQQVYKQLDKPI